MPVNLIREVRELIGNGDCLSPSLRLTKYAKVGDKNEKRKAIEWFCKAKPYMPSGVPDLFAENIPGAESFVMKLGGRLIVNQAGGVLENAGLCIHRHFGYPYIPGSALKGIARHAAWWEWSETDNDEIATDIAKIFGYPTGEKKLDSYLKSEGFCESQGKVSFLDAVPVDSNFKLVTDILTSHHDCDTKNPTPLPFPVVEKGATFTFTLVSENLDLRVKAIEYLKTALLEDGAGAKTAAGYGWFKEV